MPDHDVYVKLSDQPRAHTRQVSDFGGDLVVDVDELGQPVGIEILGALSVDVDGRSVTPEPPREDVVRMSVWINLETQAVLLRLKAADMSVTEAVRRGTALLAYFEHQRGTADFADLFPVSDATPPDYTAEELGQMDRPQEADDE